MRKSFLLVLEVSAFFAALLSISSVRAEDWPQWRGPNRDGVWNETGVLESFPRDGLKIRWRTPVSAGHSGPAVAKGRVFLTDYQLQPKPLERVLCFEETTGKPLWTHSYECVYGNDMDVKNEGPRATPTVHDGKVYTLGTMGHLFCLDATTGKELWRKDLMQAYQTRPPVWGICASPLVEDNLLIVCPGGKPDACVAALDKNTGKEVWKSLNDDLEYSSPIVVTAGGQRQVIVWSQNAVTSLAPATGKTYWRISLKTQYGAVATPVFAKDRLLLSGLMLKLDPDKPGASVLWPNPPSVKKRLLSDVSTPLLWGDQVYSARSTGEFICLEAGTGKQLWETDKLTGMAAGGACIHTILQGDRVFLFTDKGELVLVKLGPRGHQEIGRALLLSPTTDYRKRKVLWAHPAFANLHVFARSDKELICASLAAKP